VVPELPNGALQQSITVPDAQLYPVPESMPVSAAAALHIAYQTAHVALHHRAGLRAGDTVLVPAATSSVGLAAIQTAEQAGLDGNPDQPVFRGARTTPDAVTAAREGAESAGEGVRPS